jgi:hypothetical protein
MKTFNGTITELLDNSEFIEQFEAARHAEFAAGGAGTISRKELMEKIAEAQYIAYTGSRALAHWLKLLDGMLALDEKTA